MSAPLSNQPPSAAWRRPTAAGLVLLLAMVSFFPVFWNDFVSFDDPFWLVENPALNPPNFSKLLSLWSGPYLALYTPLAHTLWYIVSLLSHDGTHLRPVYFHAASLLLHLANSLLAYSLLRRFLGTSTSRWFGAVGAAIFAVHPLTVEAVAWASGLKDLLATFFILATLRSLPSGSSPQPKQFVLPTLLLVLALFSKPTAVALPLMEASVLLITDRNRPRALLAPAVLAALVTTPFMVLTVRWQPAVAVPDAVSGIMRPLVIADTYGFYVAQFGFPRSFSIDYARSAGYVVRDLHFLPYALLFVVVITAILWSRDRILMTAVALFVLPIAPVSGVKDFDFSAYSIVADHYAYPALFGLALLVTRLAQLLLTRWHWLSKPVAIASLLAVGVLATRTFLQVQTWRSSESLYRHGVSVSPRSVMMNSNLASLLLTAETPQPAQSLAYSEAALLTWPTHPYSHYNAGKANLLLGRPEEAIKHFDAAAPSFATRSSAFHVDIGDAYMLLGNTRQAAANYWEAIRINPNHPTATQKLHDAEKQLR